MRLYFLVFILSMITACGGSSNTDKTVSNASPKPADKLPEYNIEIVKTYNHDAGAFTQGLVMHNGFLYEGTGGYRTDKYKSSLRKVELDTAKVLQKVDLGGEYFGEGITIFKDKIYQLTWQEQTAFVYDVNDFKLLKEIKYSGEGWGLTHDDTNLFLSDGTHIIRVIDPETFQTLRTIAVMDERGKPIMKLNELEYIKGEIWANIWEKGWIIRIDPQTGKLLGRIDANKLADEQSDASESLGAVLNGIAYDAATDRIFITGKLWRHLYEVKVVPRETK